jgi:hypothetical protein
MMIRGRHRGLPYQLDHAILLPSDQRDSEYEGVDNQTGLKSLHLGKIKRFHTAYQKTVNVCSTKVFFHRLNFARSA